MAFNRAILLQYLYTLGVVVSGVFVQQGVSQHGRIVVLGVSAVIAAFWILYYRGVVSPRIEQLQTTTAE